MARKISQKLSWLILVNFGRARNDQNVAQMAQDGAKLEPSWRQDGPSWGQDGHLEATWGAILATFGGLGGDLCKKCRSVKTTNPPSLLVVFWGPGSSLGDSLGSVLEGFGTKMLFFEHLGTKMASAKMSQHSRN